MRYLLDNPDQLAFVQGEPALVGAAADASQPKTRAALEKAIKKGVAAVATLLPQPES